MTDFNDNIIHSYDCFFIIVQCTVIALRSYQEIMHLPKIGIRNIKRKSLIIYSTGLPYILKIPMLILLKTFWPNSDQISYTKIPSMTIIGQVM